MDKPGTSKERTCLSQGLAMPAEELIAFIASTLYPAHPPDLDVGLLSLLLYRRESIGKRQLAFQWFVAPRNLKSHHAAVEQAGCAASRWQGGRRSRLCRS
jgi:hypothetical protein